MTSAAETDSRATADVGRQARLHLGFGRRGDRTQLVASYAEPPYRIPRGFPEPGGGLHAILAFSAPGMFGGDCFMQSVDVAAGACVRLTSQSAQQAHPSRDRQTARLTAEYRVAPGGHLHCAWDPVIPFAAARLEQHVHIDLADAATLFWSDATMAGREAHGERWAFARLSHELRIVRGGVLVYLERYVLDASGPLMRCPWIAGDACYFGTAVMVGLCGAQAAEALHRDLTRANGVEASVDCLEDGVVLVRLLSASGPAFHDARAQLASAGQGVA